MASPLRAAFACLILVYAAWIPLSFAMAPNAPFGAHQEREVAFLGRGIDALPLLSEEIRTRAHAIANGEGPFADAFLRQATWAALMVLASAAALFALGWLARAPEAALTRELRRKLLRAGLAFGGLAFFAYPAFTQDPWMGVAWGRMWADGLSPYHHDFSDASLEGLPLAAFDLRMVYGPLWAWITAGLASLSGRSAWGALVLLKTLQLACWAGCLVLISRITAPAPRRHAVALVLFGWLPFSVHFAVAEAHNDVIMVVGLVGWLALLHAGRATSGLALLASALVKYVTAPLLALEVWHRLRGTPRRGGRALGLLGAGLLAGLLLATPFLLEGPLFEDTAKMQFRTLSPAKALYSAWGRWMPGPDLPIDGADALVAVAFVVLLVPVGLRFLARASLDRLVPLAFLALCVASLLALRHTWPWWLLWPFAVGCLIWDSRLFLGFLPIFVVAPFFDLFWLQDQGWAGADRYGLWLYLAAATGVAPCGWLLAPGRRALASPPHARGPTR